MPTTNLTPASFLLNGYHPRDRYKHEYFNFDPLLTSVRFNTVEGFAIKYGASFSKLVDTLNNRYLFIAAKAGYGFSDHIITGGVNGSIPLNSFTLGFDAGSDIVNLNDTKPISPFINSLHSLLRRENYEKFYQKKSIGATLYKRLYGGWQANAGLEWADRTWLPNATNFSFYNGSKHQYSSNNPLIPSEDIPLFSENQSFKFTFRTTYDFSDKYETYPNGRRYLPSPYPTIGLTYTKGIKDFLGSDVDYDLIAADISKTNMDAGVLGRTSFYVSAGKFLNNNSLFYPDFKQFSGNQAVVFRGGIDNFLLLNYYTFSTYTQFLEGHIEQNFSGFILNKIPLIRKLKLQEIVDINYLNTTSLKNYTELGAGIQYLGFRLMYGHSYNSGSNVKQAIRLGVNF